MRRINGGISLHWTRYYDFIRKMYKWKLSRMEIGGNIWKSYTFRYNNLIIILLINILQMQHTNGGTYVIETRSHKKKKFIKYFQGSNNSYPNYLISEEESIRIKILTVWLTIMIVFIHSSMSEVSFSDGDLIFEVPVWLDWIKYIISNVISRCAVPTFFFLSAILLYKKPFSWWDNIKKKFHTLLIPYIVLNTFWIGFYFVAQNINMVSVYFSNPDKIVANWGAYSWADAYLGLTGCPILYPLWFIRDLIALQVIAKLLKMVIDRFPKIIAILLIVLFFFNVRTNIFCLSMHSILFFSAGYYVVKYDLHFSDLEKINSYALVALYFGSIVGDCITRGMAYQYIIHNIAIIIGIVFFAKLTTQITNGRFRNLLLWMSQFSMAIYLFHENSLTIYTKLVARLLPVNWLFHMLQYFGNVFIIIFLCILFSIFLKRFLPGLYMSLNGNR